MARRHLKLAQLWRCPVSWCTVWKGTPQDLMDHIRDGHNVPGGGGDQGSQPRNAFSSIDSYMPAVCRVPDSSTFRHFERCTCTSVQRGGVVASSSLPCAQNRPAACCISWEVFGAAACSPTGEHDPVDSGRAIRRCLFAGVIDGTSDGYFGCHASSVWTSPPADSDHGYACPNCASTYGTGPMYGGRSRGV